MTFTLEPKDLSPTATRVTLNLDGQSLDYFNNATRPQPMTWPGKDGTGVITLAFQPIDGSPEVMVSETGSWAWLRMLRGGRFTDRRCPSLQPAPRRRRPLRRLRAPGRQRRQPLRPADVREVLMPAADLILPGFFGKLPAAGDFVSRRLPRDFVRFWDRWVARHLVPRLAAGHAALLPARAGAPPGAGHRAAKRRPGRPALPADPRRGPPRRPPPDRRRWFAALADAGAAAAAANSTPTLSTPRLRALPLPAAGRRPPRRAGPLDRRDRRPRRRPRCAAARPRALLAARAETS